ncbi:hypothetical protein [Ruegeria sp. Alg231-54]|uniref:hypothetical protein n=1 Tax=Ruegeria sp. Alg231-54 TaxID=1922221 RepID=UPI00131F0B3C|nr:hypothetical protein [Ruegeria sp. Alg231-54]
MSYGLCNFELKSVRSILGIAVIAAGFGAMTSTTAFAQVFMTQEELLATILGGQLSGVSNNDGKTPWVQAYSKATSKKNGKLNGLWDGKDKYTGDWFVKDDQWCEKGNWGQKCWSVERIGANEFRIYENGQPKKNTWKLK